MNTWSLNWLSRIFQKVRWGRLKRHHLIPISLRPDLDPGQYITQILLYCVPRAPMIASTTQAEDTRSGKKIGAPHLHGRTRPTGNTRVFYKPGNFTSIPRAGGIRSPCGAGLEYKG